MRSSFFEFNVATTGLFTSRAALEVTSHNISNASTVGYSRQQADIRAGVPLNFFNGKGMVGTGSTVTGISQIRNTFLDKKYWAESPVMGEFSVKDTQLAMLETTLNELGGTGLKTQFDELFKSLQDLSTNSGDDTYRISFLKKAEALTKFAYDTTNALKKQQSDVNAEVKTTVELINNLGDQIKSLNEQIFRYEADGSNANDLRDQRVLLLDELSKYVNIEVEEREYNEDFLKGKYPDPEDRGKSVKRLSVTINGYEFINHNNTIPLVLEKRTDLKNEMDTLGLYDIYFMGSNVKLDIYHPNLQGELKGLIDVRDGNNNVITEPNGQTSNYKGIPYYLNKLNELVRVFAKAMNEGTDASGNPIKGVIGHVNGYDRYGNLGEQLFVNSIGNSAITNYNNITCLNLSVNTNIINDPKKLAAASTSNTDQSDNKVIEGFLELNNYSALFTQGKISDFIIGVTSEVGIDRKQASNFKNNYTDVLSNIDNERISVYGVDMNEESVNLIKFNQMYTASAKLINIIDRIYDTCINRLGAF